jgi:hypothetical protein
MNAYLAIDDWGFAKRFSIQRCEISSKTIGIVPAGIPIEDAETPRISARTKSVTVAPEGTVILVSEFTEIRRQNDQIVTVFLSPTKNPRIHVSANGFGYQIDFGVINAQYAKSPVSETYTMDGMYFPPGNVRLRWWPKRQLDLPSSGESPS